MNPILIVESFMINIEFQTCCNTEELRLILVNKKIRCKESLAIC